MHDDAVDWSRGMVDVGSTDGDLLERAQEASSDAWTELVVTYGPRIYYWLRRGGARREDAQDLVQEVLGAVTQGLARFDRQRSDSSFRGWLWVITQNKLRDHFRRNQGQVSPCGGSSHARRMAALPDTALSSLSGSGSADATAGQVSRALEVIQADFREQTWQAFWLSAVEDISSVEVGELLGMTPTAVRLAKLRVLRRLHDELRAGGD